MTDRLALSAYLATHGIKLVHVWQTGGHWNAMLEWPFDPTLKRPLPTEKHATGLGDSATAAVIAGLDRLGHSTFLVRLYLLGRVLC